MTPSSMFLRGGWRDAGCVTAGEMVVCFHIIFHTALEVGVSRGWYISAFDVTAGVIRRGQSTHPKSSLNKRCPYGS